MNVAAGIDIGGTNAAFGITDEKGNVLFKSSIPMSACPSPEECVEAVSKEIIQALDESWNLIGVGIGAPNGNFFSGCIEFAPNLNWKGKIELAKQFSDKLSVNALLTNDANAAALGEMIFGKAQGISDFIFITLGTGLGSGIVVQGNMVYGHDGFAGELGHAIVEKNGRNCGCGRKGCLETYCSATGLVRTYLQKTAEVCNPAPESITARQIAELADKGDRLAIETFEFTGEVLGFALANAVTFSSPKAIYLFGGLANAGDRILLPTRKAFEENLLNIYQNKCTIEISGLPESDAAILGAASLIWGEFKH